jgi:hypothetical protein
VRRGHSAGLRRAALENGENHGHNSVIVVIEQLNGAIEDGLTAYYMDEAREQAHMQAGYEQAADGMGLRLN